MSKTKEKKIKKQKKISARKIAVIITLIFIVILYIGIPLLFQKEENNLRFERIYYVSQIVSSIFVIAGVIIAVWQYYLNSRIAAIQSSKENIQKAIDLAGYYKNNILDNYIIIKYVYDFSGISEIINKINPNSMAEFDEMEIEMLLTPEQIDKLKKIEEKNVFIKAIANASEIFEIELEKKVRLNSEGETEVHIDRAIAVDKFINGVVQETLNNMEFFAMHFTHNTAEDSVVYQSLHKTYIDMVRALYYNISKCNKLGETYFYTNVIALYNKWNAQYIEDKNKKKIEHRNGETAEKI